MSSWDEESEGSIFINSCLYNNLFFFILMVSPYFDGDQIFGTYGAENFVSYWFYA